MIEPRRDGPSTGQPQQRVIPSITSPFVSASPKDPFQVSAPAIVLPEGRWCHLGMGEKFASNQVTAAGSMTVPVACIERWMNHTNRTDGFLPSILRENASTWYGKFPGFAQLGCVTVLGKQSRDRS